MLVNDELYKKIKMNILFVRTVDTGSYKGRRCRKVNFPRKDS